MKNINSLELFCIDYILLNINKFDISKFDYVIKEKILNRLLKPKEPAFSYKGTQPPQPTLHYIEKLIDSENTRSLDLTNLNISVAFSDQRFRFFNQCKSLTSITLTRSPSLTSQKAMEFLKFLGSNLQSLNLSQCLKLDDTIIHYISFYCGDQLKQLNLEDCIGISGSIFQRCTNTILNSFEDNHNIINSNNSFHNNNGNNKIFMKRMENLIDLNLSGCKSINPNNLYSIKSVFPNLKVFSFGKNFLSDEDGQTLVQILPRQLESLDLSFNPIGRQTLSSLISSNYRLKSLCLGYCRCITAIDLTNLLISLYKSLEYLSIPGCFQIDSLVFENLTNGNIQDGLDNINPLFKRRSSTSTIALKKLDISHCTQFTNQKLLKFQSGCRESLEILRYNNQGFNHQFSLK